MITMGDQSQVAPCMAVAAAHLVGAAGRDDHGVPEVLLKLPRLHARVLVQLLQQRVGQHEAL